jgi:hypothetical protein
MRSPFLSRTILLKCAIARAWPQVRHLPGKWQKPSCPSLSLSLSIRLLLTLFLYENKYGTYHLRAVAKYMSTPIIRPGIEELRERTQRLERAADRRRLVLAFGIKAIDRHLPGAGLALGALHEVAGGGHGAIDGAAAALFTAGIAARTRGKVLWCITRPDLFAPALAQAGLIPDRVIYVEAGDEKSVLVCFEEGLRHGGFGAVVAEVARLSMTASRRALASRSCALPPRSPSRSRLNR